MPHLKLLPKPPYSLSRPCVQHVGKELLELIVTIAWCMRYNRNKTRHGAPRQSSRDIIHKARLILEEYKLAHLQKPLHKEHADIRWIPPDYPWYKINVDAAVFSNKRPWELVSWCATMKVRC